MSRFVGREKLDFPFLLTMTVYNLADIRNLYVDTCALTVTKGLVRYTMCLACAGIETTFGSRFDSCGKALAETIFGLYRFRLSTGDTPGGT